MPSRTTCAPREQRLVVRAPERVSESSGAMSASASTRPACRAPTVMRPLRVARPSGSSATPVSAGTARPSPAPQNASAIATRTFEIARQQRQGDEAAREQRSPAERSGASLEASCRERPHRERRRGERAHDERADDRVERPDGDHEQHARGRALPTSAPKTSPRPVSAASACGLLAADAGRAGASRTRASVIAASATQRRAAPARRRSPASRRAA